MKKRDIRLFEDMNEGYYEVDLKGRFTFVNQVACQVADMRAEDIIGLNLNDYTSPQTARRVSRGFNQVYKTGLPMKLEYDFTFKGKKTKTVENSANVLRDENGEICGFCGLVTDITHRKRLEERLRESKTRFEALFENANELIITTDKNGYILRINKMAEEFSEYSRKELIGKSILILSYREDREKYIAFWQRLLKGENPRFELRGISKTGKIAYLLASGSVVRKNKEIIEVQYNAQIISDLKEAQKTIEGLTAHLNSIIESSPNMIICLNAAGIIEKANPITQKIFSRSMDAIIGKNLSEIDPELSELDEIIHRTEKDKHPCFLPERHLPSDPSQVFGINIYPLTNRETDHGVVLTAIDITEKKNMELQLIHAQKMETIGELAGGVAHDFNNILTAISGNLNMLKMSRDIAEHTEYIDRLEKITDRASGLVSQLLMFSRRNKGETEATSLGKVLNEVMDMTSKSVKKNIRIDLGDINEKFRILVDHTQLTQVFMNLVINAMDAIEKKEGHIQIEANPILVNDQTRRTFLLEKTGSFVRIDVKDNGEGMDNTTLTKIFDPFFTTKEKGKGTGLGLSIIYNIIKDAGGGIQVLSEKGKGSRFTVVLPLTEKEEKLSKEKTALKTMTRNARILLVDDEDMLRDIGSEMLEFLGHEVVTASDGAECMDILKKDSAGFDLIILDMIMPGMDGHDTLREMAHTDIQTKVIVSSGFSFENQHEDILSNPLVIGSLNKPFDLKVLSRVISETIGS
ncbi:MAG: PAS domain S-box protein [Thermodesulfobacteriota bacterium]|nr:PAS domain S-box protein [Thermodesulfobacteriota bacterium]